MLSLGLFVSLISSLGLLVNGIVAFTTDVNPLYSTTSLAGIIPSDGALASVLNTFEIFSIWSLCIISNRTSQNGRHLQKSRVDFSNHSIRDFSCIFALFRFNQFCGGCISS